MDMVRIAQVLGIALALLLSDASLSTAAEESSSSRVDNQQLDDAWLDVLRDPSMDLAERLEIACTEESLHKWFVAAVKRASLEHLIAPEKQIQDRLRDHTWSEVQSEVVDTVLELVRGFMALADGVEEFGPDIDPRSFAQPSVEELDLSAVLTDPRIPNILGDEWASLLEGLVAAMGAGVLLKEEPDLARELATAFANRMQRVPRLFALISLSDGREPRGDWHRYLSPEDVATLERDARAAEQYVAGLEYLAKNGELS